MPENCSTSFSAWSAAVFLASAFAAGVVRPRKVKPNTELHRRRRRQNFRQYVRTRRAKCRFLRKISDWDQRTQENSTQNRGMYDRIEILGLQRMESTPKEDGEAPQNLIHFEDDGKSIRDKVAEDVRKKRIERRRKAASKRRHVKRIEKRVKAICAMARPFRDLAQCLGVARRGISKTQWKDVDLRNSCELTVERAVRDELRKNRSTEAETLFLFGNDDSEGPSIAEEDSWTMRRKIEIASRK